MNKIYELIDFLKNNPNGNVYIYPCNEYDMKLWVDDDTYDKICKYAPEIASQSQPHDDPSMYNGKPHFNTMTSSQVASSNSAKASASASNSVELQNKLKADVSQVSQPNMRSNQNDRIENH